MIGKLFRSYINNPLRRIIANNVVGDSQPSATFSAMAAIKPGAPEAPTRKTATTESVTIQWEAPLDDGGDPIDDYNVYWDDGVGAGSSFFLLGSSSGQTEFTKAGIETPGSAYRFKVTAINYIGEGP